MTLAELQEMAKATISTAPDADSQEDAEWIERLIRADGKHSVSTTNLRTPLLARLLEVPLL
jgi:hypothetical protein